GRGVRGVTGGKGWRPETSRALQLTILEELGLPYPKARVIHNPSQAPGAAHGLRFPVVVKANIGGSGAGIVRFDTPEALQKAADANAISPGLHSTALRQGNGPRQGGRRLRLQG